MGKVTGFLEIDRQDRKYRPASDRIRNFREFIVPLPEQVIRDQASRCMECGIPFCHDMKGLKGCPVNNQIPDWNDLVYRGEWEQASKDLHSTNNFPEFTGRICPAPCEASCTLNIVDSPVTIKSIECSIVDKAWDKGWIKPQINQNRRIGDSKTKSNSDRLNKEGASPKNIQYVKETQKVPNMLRKIPEQDSFGSRLSNQAAHIRIVARDSSLECKVGTQATTGDPGGTQRNPARGPRGNPTEPRGPKARQGTQRGPKHPRGPRGTPGEGGNAKGPGGTPGGPR